MGLLARWIDRLHQRSIDAYLADMERWAVEYDGYRLVRQEDLALYVRYRDFVWKPGRSPDDCNPWGSLEPIDVPATLDKARRR